jgi:HEAT repeat protein
MSSEARQRTRRGLQECHRFRDAGNVGGLVAQLQTHESLDVRLCAARGLGRLGDAAAVTALAAAATADTDPRVREVSMRALAAIDQPAAIPTLVHQLRNGVARVRRTAAALLSKAETEETAAVLRDALQDSDWYVRVMAAAGLAGRKEPALREALREARRRERNPLIWIFLWRYAQRTGR